jgi:hypothetical protein
MARVQEPKPLPGTKDLQSEYDKAKTALDSAKENTKSALTVAARNSAQVRLDNAQKAFDAIKTKYDEAKKREGTAQEAAAEGTAGREALRSKGLETIRVRQERVNAARTAYQKQPNKQDLFDKYQRELGVLSTSFDEYAAKGFDFPRTVEPSAGGGYREINVSNAIGAPASTAEVSVADRASQQSVAERTSSDTAQGSKTQVVTKNGVQVKVTTDAAGNTTETPVSSAAAGTQVSTPSTSVTSSAIGKGTRVTKQVVTPTIDWEASLRQYVPSKAWMLDLDRTKYPQLFALLKTAAEQGYYNSQEGLQRFANELDATDFYKELADSSQRRDIKKLVGDLGFDNTDFSKFVSDSINFGWEGDTLKQKTYEEVFRRNPDGTYTNPTAVARATKGNDYLGVQLTAKSYFNNASPAAIENVLTGQITGADFARQQRELAKTRYGHLSNLIDQGVTLEDLAANYKSSAAKLLEIDPNQIDMSQADYEIALAYDDNGNKRAMTTGEWEKMLRSDPRYGWEKTNNAKTEARSLASNIAQAFGRII